MGPLVVVYVYVGTVVVARIYNGPPCQQNSLTIRIDLITLFCGFGFRLWFVLYDYQSRFFPSKVFRNVPKCGVNICSTIPAGGNNISI